MLWHIQTPCFIQHFLYHIHDSISKAVTVAKNKDQLQEGLLQAWQFSPPAATSHAGKGEAKKVEPDTENKGGREAAKDTWVGLCWNERKKSEE